MLKLKKRLFEYFNKGISSDTYNDNSKIFIINLFAFIGMTITAMMAISALVNNNHPLALALFGSSIIYYLGRYIHIVSNNKPLASSVILINLFILMFFLVYTGGVNNTGPLWIFMVAPVALFFDGLKIGLLKIFVFICVLSIMLFTPENAFLATHYSTDFKLRLIYSFLTCAFLSGLYEYSRQKSYESLKTLSMKFEQLSKLDPLTQLSNRRDATNKLEYEQNKLERNNSKLSIMLCDVDCFKQVNDIYGHEIGDFVLKELARLFKQQLRKQDVVSRWGGEEFLFILPDTDVEQSMVLANKILAKLREHTIKYNEHEFKVSVSIGVALLTHNEKIQHAINLADTRLYKAKRAGRDQVFFEQ